MSLPASGNSPNSIELISPYRIFVGMYDEDSDENWIVVKGFQDSGQANIYVSALYFTVTTIVTVGYGDISASNMGEKIFCIFLMLIGVISFSFATGTLASLITSYDSKEGKLKEKLAVLEEIHEEYGLETDFYNEISRSIQFNHRKKEKEFSLFMDDLPHKLRLGLSMILYEKMYKTINFMQGKDPSFIAWVSAILRPLNIEDQKLIYEEGD